MKYFFVYILKCNDGSYYIGHTDNIEKRILEHNAGKFDGYTSKRLPIKVVWTQPFASRYEALSAEHKLKKWSKAKKEALISNGFESVKKFIKENKNNKKGVRILQRASLVQDERDVI